MEVVSWRERAKDRHFYLVKFFFFAAVFLHYVGPFASSYLDS
jgi:hypothetical protein